MTKRQKIAMLKDVLAKIDIENESISCVCAEGPEFMSKAQICEHVLSHSFMVYGLIKSTFAKLDTEK